MRISLTVLYVCLSSFLFAQPADLSDREQRRLEKMIDLHEAFAGGHTGFCLYDLTTEGSIYNFQADRYFVPASNVKLFTFYIVNQVLHRRAPAVFYQQYSDRIELWGAGYPLTLHPGFTGFDELTPWLASSSLPLVVNIPREDEVPRYGAGWSWDDYNYGYVYERSAFPVYGNRLSFYRGPVDSSGVSIVGSPPAIAANLHRQPQAGRRISREENANIFSVEADFFTVNKFPREVALRMDAPLVARSLSEALPANSISLSNKARPPFVNLNYYEVALPDTVYRKFLQQSDNFLAEQLLLQAAARRYGRLSETDIIDYATDTLFQSIGLGKIKLADASGLSRYNLATPRQLALVAAKLYRDVGPERLLDLLPAGGKTGTLERRFNDKRETYVWAKTGSLSGVICLTGIIKTKDNRWLTFSFTHNNVIGSSNAYYRQMEAVLGWIYENL